jgi:hypothetical protein
MPASRKPRAFEIDQAKLTETEKNRIITLREAEELSSLSVDSWTRNHRDKLIQLTDKRVGIRLRHALFLD